MSCAVCGCLVGLKRCGRCRAVWYCSGEHQKQDWGVHKSVCKRTNETQETTSPSPTPSQWRVPSIDASLFPPLLRRFSYGESGDKVSANLLILLHGLGDTKEPYHKFAQSINLPKTSWISLEAPHALLDLGYYWYTSFQDNGDLIQYDPKRLEELDNIRSQLQQFLKVLKDTYNFKMKNIFLFGFSQGATVAIDLILNWKRTSTPIFQLQDLSLGGCVCLSGLILEEHIKFYEKGGGQTMYYLQDTPVFVSHGFLDKRENVETMRRKVAFLKGLVPSWEVTYKEYAKGHEMIKSKEETYDFMQFMSNHLYQPQIHLGNSPDVIEITGQQKQHILKNIKQ
eukprot:TRINITY_DN2295_c0_g1_i1.p2 TRINITY_DN2295_c0_g1~~TRINITY_DN2295_c0_g1_i1.p2  ORF type:complete len:339 (+),score=82.82 TRINITY_DN2295_c0_g1_i1:1120-2136(+)